MGIKEILAVVISSITLSGVFLYILALILRDKFFDKRYLKAEDFNNYKSEMKSELKDLKQSFEKGNNDIKKYLEEKFENRILSRDELYSKFVAVELCEKTHETEKIITGNIEKSITELKDTFNAFKHEINPLISNMNTGLTNLINELIKRGN